jgi:hypothetical protein
MCPAVSVRPDHDMSGRTVIHRGHRPSNIRARAHRYVAHLSAAFALLLTAAVAHAQSPPSAGGATPAPQSSSSTSGTPPDAQEIANQANNPAAPLTLLQFRNVTAFEVRGSDGPINEFQIQPVIPIGPFKSFAVTQLIKATIPFESIPSPSSDSGLGDFDLFDLVSIKQSWGRWGVGVALTFPTASSDSLGQGKWQAGPAAAAIYTGVKNLTAGAILQNPVSYAGDSDRPAVNNLIITPTFTYNLEKGWFIGLSDYNLTFDWEHGGDATIPLGVQFGRVVRIHRQMVSLSVEAGGAVTQAATLPDTGWIVGLEFTPIFKWYLK